MFTTSKGFKENEDAYSLDFIHKSKMYVSILYNTIEEAKNRAEAFSVENKRVKVRYCIAKGKLKGKMFITTGSDIRIRGEKVGNSIIWDKPKTLY